MAKKLEIFIIQKMMNIPSISGEKVVHAEYLISFTEELVAEMAAQKATTTAY